MDETREGPSKKKKKKNDLLTLSVILVIASLGSSVMVLVRWILTGKLTHSYLVWNLFLAWVPYLIALFLLPARRMRAKGPRRFIVSAIGFAWLAFYPNSPYIFTDMIHVVNRSYLNTGGNEWLTPTSLIWYDLILNSTFAFIGHFIGLISLSIVHDSIKLAWNRAVGWATCAAAVCLAGGGIYVGRFVRLNSWDIFTSPAKTLSRISVSIFTPRALLFSMSFAFFIAATYLMLYIFRRVDLSGGENRQ